MQSRSEPNSSNRRTEWMTRRRLQQKDGERIRLFGRAAEIHIRMVSPASWSLNNSGVMSSAIFSNASHSRKNVITESADRHRIRRSPSSALLSRRRRSSPCSIRSGRRLSGRSHGANGYRRSEGGINERDRTGGGHGRGGAAAALGAGALELRRRLCRRLHVSRPVRPVRRPGDRQLRHRRSGARNPRRRHHRQGDRDSPPSCSPPP